MWFSAARYWRGLWCRWCCISRSVKWHRSWKSCKENQSFICLRCWCSCWCCWPCCFHKLCSKCEPRPVSWFWRRWWWRVVNYWYRHCWSKHYATKIFHQEGHDEEITEQTRTDWRAGTTDSKSSLGVFWKNQDLFPWWSKNGPKEN